ncbi:MAG: hypothetical protein QNK05_23710 [Myxococcota bacterium]|nr:hypothetical protein [Myxococcota bacterium]
MARSDDGLPDIAEILGGVFAKVSEAERPLLLAAAERLAGERYRRWAEQHDDPEVCAGLRACAEREDAIASRVEALHPDAERIQQAIFERLPELPELNESIFAGRPLQEQFTIQARGERAGASTWEAFAKAASDERTRVVYEGNVPLEIESATFLESLVED